MRSQALSPPTKAASACAGGVCSAANAYKKIRLGASLVQLLTALIYQGPGVVRGITKGLAQLLARDGVKNVADVVGVDVV